MRTTELLYSHEITRADFLPDTDVIPLGITEMKERFFPKNTLLFILQKAMKRETLPLHIYAENVTAVVTDDDREIFTDLPIIRVKNAREAYATALSRYYGIDYEKMSVIGVTGTNGKTTTATLVYRMLKSAGHKVGFIGTGKIEIDGERLTDDFYSMTTPDPDQLYRSLKKMQEEKCQFAVMEVSSHSIALGKILPIKFKCGIFTNLSPEHMDFHTDMQEYYDTKAKLFGQCEIGIFNLDDEYSCRAMREARCQKHGIGVIHNEDIYATDISLSGLSGSYFIYRDSGLMFGVKTRLCGAFNVYNSMLALACAIKLGIKPCVAKKAINEIRGVEGRMEKIEDGVTVIIDYAHTPLALKNTLKTIKDGKNPKQKLITVFGCGGERDREKRPEMGKISAEYSDISIITEDNNRGESFTEILADIERGIPSGTKYKVFEKREEAIFSAIIHAKKNDIIAIVGKGHERYKAVGNEKRPFDERIIIESALTARRRLCKE